LVKKTANIILFTPNSVLVLGITPSGDFANIGDDSWK
jgi:hypothetical protein